jgi:hypothetical protein
MGAWMATAVERYGDLRSLRLRFRSPLRPAVPAVVSGAVTERTDARAEFDLELSSPSDRLVTGRAVVTPW